MSPSTRFHTVVDNVQYPRLTPLDATFLELEDADPTAHMHIGATLVFRPPAGGCAPSVKALRETIAQRLPALPLYRCRLSDEKPGLLHLPHWVEDGDFDLGRHIKHAELHAPGTREQLFDWASDYWSKRLDRARPLWEMTLLTGLDGGCWAICTKTHHCMVDGVGSVDAAYLFLDTEPDAERSFEAAPLDLQPERRLIGRLPDAVAHGARAAVAVARHPSKFADVLDRSRAMAELVARDELVAAPHTSLNVPIGVHRRFDALRVPLAHVKLIKNELGGTVNDVVLAAAASGLRELLLARGEEPPADGLRAMVPVNIRTGGDTLGNRITSLFVHLPVGEANALARYIHTLDEAEALKAGSQARGGETLVQLAGLAPPVVHSLLARSLFASRLFNITITNVPGPQQPLYGLGSRLTEIFPLVPLAADHSVGIAVVSYDGNLYFGLIGDRDSARDLEVLRVGIARAVTDLREFAAARSHEHSRVYA
jgi:WS/DGAT/MGAT family acyltransferase